MPHCIDGQTLDNDGSDFCFFDGKNWEKEIKLKEEFVSKMSKEKWKLCLFSEEFELFGLI